MSPIPVSTSAALELVAQDMRDMDAVIEQRLASEVPLVGQISRYIVAAGGKRARRCGRRVHPAAGPPHGQ